MASELGNSRGKVGPCDFDEEEKLEEGGQGEEKRREGEAQGGVVENAAGGRRGESPCHSRERRSEAKMLSPHLRILRESRKVKGTAT